MLQVRVAVLEDAAAPLADARLLLDVRPHVALQVIDRLELLLTLLAFVRLDLRHAADVTAQVGLRYEVPKTKMDPNLIDFKNE